MKRWIVFAAFSMLACGRSPTPALYTLQSEPGSARASGPLRVEVREPRIAGYLDRHQIVRAVVEQELVLARDAIWAEPLAAMLGRVLAANLGARLPRARVFRDAGGVAADADVRVSLDVRRFERSAEGPLVMSGLLALSWPAASHPTVLQPFEVREAPEGRDVTALVASMNRVLAKLADDIASSLEPPSRALSAPER